MAGDNMIVTTTVNKVVFQTDKGSYQETLKKIRSVKSEFEKVGKSVKINADLNQSTKALKQAQQAAKATQAQSQAAKAAAKAEKEAAAARVAAERKLQQIRAKGIRFNTSIANANISGKQRTEALSSFGDLTRQYHGNKLGLQEYNAKVAALQSQVRQQGKIGMKGYTLPVNAKVTSLDTTLLDHAKGALTIGATIALSGKVLDTGRDFDSLQSTLLAVTGSSEKAAKEFQYLQDQSNRLGLSLIDTGTEYAKFSAATKNTLTESQTKNVFEGLAEYSTVLGLSADKASLALNALTQMSSKSVVSMEELRQQFGDHIPAAIDIFTKAYNKMNGKNLGVEEFTNLVGQGKILSKSVLPAVGDELKALARNGGALDKAMKSNRASWQRLQTAMQSSMNEFYTSGFGEASTDLFNTLTAFLNNNADTFKWWGHIAGQVVEGATDAFSKLYNSVVLTARVTEYYLKKMGVTGEQMSSWALDWPPESPDN